MFAALKIYSQEMILASPDGKWDGNVPANFKTKCQKNLGRWVHRQRSAYSKNKLKKEYIERLDSLGLKWAVTVDSNRKDDGTSLKVQPIPTEKKSSTFTPFAVNSSMIHPNLSHQLLSLPKITIPMTNNPALSVAIAQAAQAAQAAVTARSLSAVAMKPIVAPIQPSQKNATLIESKVKVKVESSVSKSQMKPVATVSKPDNNIKNASKAREERSATLTELDIEGIFSSSKSGDQSSSIIESVLLKKSD